MGRKELSGNEIIVSGVIFFAALAVGDSIAHGQVDTSKEHSAPVAVLPNETVLFPPPKRLKK